MRVVGPEGSGTLGPDGRCPRLAAGVLGHSKWLPETQRNLSKGSQLLQQIVLLSLSFRFILNYIFVILSFINLIIKTFFLMTYFYLLIKVQKHLAPQPNHFNVTKFSFDFSIYPSLLLVIELLSQLVNTTKNSP